MRLFVCTFLSQANAVFYEREIGRIIREHHEILKPIPRRSAHVTYAFLGEVPDLLLADVRDSVAGVVARIGAFDIMLGAPFVLYARREARLIAAPIAVGEALLGRLADELRAALARLPLTAPLADAHALHVTLARFRKGTRRTHAKSVETICQQTGATFVREDRVRSVQVVSSELTPAGPVYRVEREAALR